MNIRLTRQEFDYLKNAAFLTPHQVDVLLHAEMLTDTEVSLTLTRDTAEEFRTSFTYQLGRVGFDKNYDLTPEGRMIEDLIDLFFVGSQQ